MRTITAEQWRNTPKDYKGIYNGVRKMLVWDEKHGTVLVPVEVIREPRIKKQDKTN